MKQEIKAYIERSRQNGPWGNLLGETFDIARLIRRKIKFYSNLPYRSEFGQDKLVDGQLKKNEGFYVDVGAHNGIDFSNSYFLHKSRGWKGICIEPNQRLLKQLIANREEPNCLCLPYALDSYSGQAEFIDADACGTLKSRLTSQHEQKFLQNVERKISTVQVKTLREILEPMQINYVDYLSLDTEGNELEILKGVDWQKTNFGIIGVENNWNDDSVKTYLEARGYNFYKRLGVDDFFLPN